MSKKRALVVGINYVGTSNELRGCVNDANALHECLVKKGYECVVLLDAEATRTRILKELYNLILSDAKTLYFHYSGHGGQVVDIGGADGDELDGMDETLVPVDFESAGMIIDDEIRGLLVSLSEEKKMTITLDCCHSGTGVDLAYNAYERITHTTLVRDEKQLPTRGKVVCLSGCQDRQTSADAFIGGTFQGALTNALLANFDKCATWLDLYKGVNDTLRKGKYSQISCLSSGTKLDLKNALWF